MIKRLWALFTKKRSSQKIFEKKLERLSGGPLTPLHHDHHADRIRELMLNSQSVPDQVRAKVHLNNLRTPPVREFDQGTKGKYGCSVERSRRGMTIDQNAISRMQLEDAITSSPVHIDTPTRLSENCPTSGSDSYDSTLAGGSCD